MTDETRSGDQIREAAVDAAADLIYSGTDLAPEPSRRVAAAVIDAVLPAVPRPTLRTLDDLMPPTVPAETAQSLAGLTLELARVLQRLRDRHFNCCPNAPHDKCADPYEIDQALARVESARAATASPTRIYHEPSGGTGVCPRCGASTTDRNAWVATDLANVSCGGDRS